MNIYLLSNSDIVNLWVREGYGSGGAEDLILLFFFFGVLSLLVGEMWWGWAENFV